MSYEQATADSLASQLQGFRATLSESEQELFDDILKGVLESADQAELPADWRSLESGSLISWATVTPIHTTLT